MVVITSSSTTATTATTAAINTTVSPTRRNKKNYSARFWYRRCCNIRSFFVTPQRLATALISLFLVSTITVYYYSPLPFSKIDPSKLPVVALVVAQRENAEKIHPPLSHSVKQRAKQQLTVEESIKSSKQKETEFFNTTTTTTTIRLLVSRYSALWYESNETYIRERFPTWMQEYFAWHASQRAALAAATAGNNNNYSKFRFLILRCVQSIDGHCGGISDRLKPLPLLLLLAAQSKRIFLIYWSKPVALEEFLLPRRQQRPQPKHENDKNDDNGYEKKDEQFLFLDWTTPTYLKTLLETDKEFSRPGTLHLTVTSLTQAIDRQGSQGGPAIVTTRLQDQHGGSTAYNERLPAQLLSQEQKQANERTNTVYPTERAYRYVFRSLWFSLFEPTLPVQMAIAQTADQFKLFPLEQQQQQLQQLPEPYAAAHLRANYGNNPLDPVQHIPWAAKNAVNCASRFGKPQVLFASDSNIAMQRVQEYSTANHLPIITLLRHSSSSSPTEPLHLDKANSVVAADYYDLFVDLYLLAGADCISHGRGGFGRFAVLLSRNASCFFTFFSQSRFVDCGSWKYHH